ncbi:MAG: hydantoinase/oxoprolinase family protein, partial [Rhodospirillales bacterium]|nr:hydantoinase/oxoprolinase family protein [Rhodospirillales bacterium]
RIEAEAGRPLGLGWADAAAAILRIANDRMAGAIRLVSLARGHDPRDFALFAFGGAGPLHAGALARELGIPKVLIPARPGLTNALGCVVADVRHDFVRTVNTPLPALEPATVRAILSAQIAEGEALLAREGVAIEGVTRLHFADMQFQGQSHMLTVPLPEIGVDVEALRAAFEAAYWTRFGVELPEIRAVLVNLHTAIIGRRPRVDLAALAAGDKAADLAGALAGRRPVWFAQGGWIDTPVYLRDRLPADSRFEGPAIVQQLDCTTVVEPGDRVSVDAIGDLVMEVS